MHHFSLYYLRFSVYELIPQGLTIEMPVGHMFVEGDKTIDQNTGLPESVVSRKSEPLLETTQDRTQRTHTQYQDGD